MDGSNLIKKVDSYSYDFLSKLFSMPKVQAVAQLCPGLAAVATYFASRHAKDSEEAIINLIHLVNSIVQSVDRKKLDKDFFDTSDGRRIVARVFMSILNDNRKEKVEAMANLAVNLQVKSSVSVDEKELFVTTLDSLNPVQLAILDSAVAFMRARKDYPASRGFSWEKIANEFIGKGVNKVIVSQSLRILQSNWIINEWSGIQPENTTHVVTDYGELFYDHITKVYV